MPNALVISNLHAPDCVGGYELVASECMDFLTNEHEWRIECHCSRTNKNGVSSEEVLDSGKRRVVRDLTGYFPRGWTGHHALFAVAKEVVQNTPRIASLLSEKAASSDVVLLFNPRRLSVLQWLPAVTSAKNPVAWVSDYWPLEYPDCDKLRRAAVENKFSWSPLVMFAAAKARKFYNAANAPAALSRDDLRHIRRAAFVSDYVLRKNASAFTNLREAVVIRNGINPALFPLAGMTAARQNTWGFCGRVQRDKGVFLALEIFAAAVARRPELRFLLAGDTSTGDGQLVRRRVADEPLLRGRVIFLGKVNRADLARRFYHNIGVLLFPSIWEEPFALTLLEAMSCGAFVAATNTGGTGEIVKSQFSFPQQPAAQSPATGFLFSPTDRPADIAAGIFASTSSAAQTTATISAARQVASTFTVRRMAAELSAFCLGK